jgi:hypothetical protein
MGAHALVSESQAPLGRSSTVMVLVDEDGRETIRRVGSVEAALAPPR